MSKFTADLRRFRAMTNERHQRIVRKSIQELLMRMQTRAKGVSIGGALVRGMMPVVSTALVTSLVSMVGGSTFRGEYSYDSAAARYKLGDNTVFFWDQIYAFYIENGDDKFAGWHFVKTNAADWNDIVQQKARETRNRR